MGDRSPTDTLGSLHGHSAQTLFESSIQAQLELNDVPVFANEPGPGHYFNAESSTFSSFGPQKFSKNASAPLITFPYTDASKWEKVVISKAHEGAYRCRLGPGHVYNPKPPGLSDISTKVGTSNRGPLQGSMGKDSPGPMAGYHLRENLDSRDATRYATLNLKTGFGTSNRFGKDGRRGLGPGEYARKDVAIQGDTGKSIAIGRPFYAKVVTPGWESEGICKQSPGVGPPLWKDPKKDGCAAYSMGKAERFGEYGKNGVPGPGWYRQDERAMCMGTTQRSGSASACTRRPSSTLFGKRPKKPRFRIQLAQTTSERGAWGYF
jgi:hypothetical protein